MTKRTGLFISLILCATLASACSIESRALALETGPHSWIDAPLDGSNLPLARVQVVSHSSDLYRITQVELSVNGQVVRIDPNPDPSQTVVTTTQSWSPAAPGNYTLEVRAQNSNGAWGSYARAVVTIGGVPTPTATLTASPPPPQPTHTPTPTRITSRPTLTFPSFSARQFYWGDATCGPKEVTISVGASDPSGIASVQIHFRLVSQSSKGMTRFTSLKMNRNGSSWTRTINSESDIPGYNSSMRSRWLQFYFTASDNHGVQTQSSTYENNILLARCVELH